MLTIPYSAYRQFCHLWNTNQISHNLRFGQAAYQYFKADKVTQNKIWWDKLYVVRNTEAEKMLLSIIDYNN